MELSERRQAWRVTLHDYIYMNYSEEVEHHGSHLVIPALSRTRQKDLCGFYTSLLHSEFQNNTQKEITQRNKSKETKQISDF